MTLIGQKSSLNKFSRYIKWYKNSWKRVKPSTKQDMTSIMLITVSKLERLKGEGKKLKPIRYGPFKILDKIGNNAFHLDLPPYMQMYAVVNVENLKLYEPPLNDDQGEHVQIPSIDDFSPEYLTELHEDTILDRRMRTSKRGNVEYLQIGLKGTNLSKAKWIEVGKVRELYSHLQID
jgi:hypothetical protein